MSTIITEGSTTPGHQTQPAAARDLKLRHRLRAITEGYIVFNLTVYATAKIIPSQFAGVEEPAISDLRVGELSDWHLLWVTYSRSAH
jgi:hypothetical protein